MPEESDKKLTDKVKKKLKDGWIKASMFIEVLAMSEEVAKSSLEKHVAMMEGEDNSIIYRKDFKEIQKVKNPLKGINEAYSNVVEIELVAYNLDKLVYLVMNYGPSSVEILEPEKLVLDAGEVQGILNSIADMIHKFVAAGVGGVVIRS